MHRPVDFSNTKIAVLVTVLLALFAGILVVGAPLRFVVTALLVIFAGAFIIAKIEVGILTVVFVVAGVIFEEALPLVPIGVGSLHLSDILLCYLIAFILLKLLTDRDFTLAYTPLSIPLFLFFVISLLSTYLAVTHFKVDFNLAMRQLRALTYYLLFFPVFQLIRTEKQVKFLIKGLFGIAGFVSLVMILQALVGESIQLMPGRVEATETLGRIYESTRILPPGQTLIYVMFITAICLIALLTRAGSKLVYFMLSFLIGIAVLLTYNRSYFVAIFVALSIFLLFISRRAKKRFIIWFSTAIILTCIVIPLLIGIGGKGKKFIISVTDRFSSLSKGKDLFYSGSVELRKLEYIYAAKEIKKHLLWGIGPANEYRPPLFSGDKGTDYIHNGYFGILLCLGIPGFVSYLLFFFGFLFRGFFHYRSVKDHMLKSAMIGFALSSLGISLACIVNPMFMQWFSIVVIALMAGISESIIINKLGEREADG